MLTSFLGVSLVIPVDVRFMGLTAILEERLEMCLDWVIVYEHIDGKVKLRLDAPGETWLELLIFGFIYIG